MKMQPSLERALRQKKILKAQVFFGKTISPLERLLAKTKSNSTLAAKCI
jgi:hypothetical protein